MTEYPRPLSTTNQLEPAPRRVHGVLGTRTVLDTVGAVYVREWPYYPRYYVPLADLDLAFLVAEHRTEDSPQSLRPAPTSYVLPLQGRTTAYWSVRVGEVRHEDLAWSYDFRPNSCCRWPGWSRSTT